MSKSRKHTAPSSSSSLTLLDENGQEIHAMSPAKPRSSSKKGGGVHATVASAAAASAMHDDEEDHDEEDDGKKAKKKKKSKENGQKRSHKESRSSSRRSRSDDEEDEEEEEEDISEDEEEEEERRHKKKKAKLMLTTTTASSSSSSSSSAAAAAASGPPVDEKTRTALAVLHGPDPTKFLTAGRLEKRPKKAGVSVARAPDSVALMLASAKHMVKSVREDDVVALVRDPDQALLIWLRLKGGPTGTKQHLFDFVDDADIAGIRVKRVDEAKPVLGKIDPKTKRTAWEKTGKNFLNILPPPETSQRWETADADVFCQDKGFFLVTYFGAGAFGEYGPTPELGVDGDYGKDFGVSGANERKDDDTNYSIALSSKNYLPQFSDAQANAFALAGNQAMKRITRHIARQTFDIVEALPQWRKEEAGQLRNMTDDQKFAVLVGASKCFRGKVDYDDKHECERFKATESVCRKLRQKESLPEDYKPPSPLFERLLEKDKFGNVRIHKEIRVWKCRRGDSKDNPDEVGPTGPLIRVPFANAAINAYHDVFAIRIGVKEYEWIQKKADVTHKITDIIWLNSKKGLQREFKTEADVKEVDPTFAIPMAGHYAGPQDGEAWQRRLADWNNNSEEAQAAVDGFNALNAEEEEDAMMAAAAAAEANAAFSA